MATVDPTTNYSWDLPTIDGSTNTWGEELNAIIGDNVTGIDAIVKAISDVADGALQKDGSDSTMTGTLTIGAGARIVEDVEPIATGTGTKDVDWSQANFFTKTITGATIFTFSNPPSSGTVQFITIELTNAGSNVTWPATVDWQDGVAPSFTASGKDIVTFYTRDGGTTYIGAHAISDPS